MNPDNLKNGDTDDLEALFDEIAEQKVWETSASDSQDEASAEESAQADSDAVSEIAQEAADAEAQAMADQLAADEEPVSAEVEPATESVALGEDPRDVFQRVGALTRKLHDALRELGYDKSVETAVNSLPDARARLAYIANLTGEAANKVLAAVERCQAVNDEMSDQAKQIDEQWDRLFANEMSLEEFKTHAKETHAFIKKVRDQSNVFGSQFTEIMMAQDFHDLTGQVVNRIAEMAQNLEEQLVELLLDTTPAEQRKQVEQQWLTGPAINAEGRTDICSDQAQVDDLLESLGF